MSLRSPSGAIMRRGAGGGPERRRPAGLRACPGRCRRRGAHTGRPRLCYCMDGLTHGAHHAPVRVLPHIKRLDECFGDFLVRVTCPCGTSRHIEPEALARIAGKSVTLAAWRETRTVSESAPSAPSPSLRFITVAGHLRGTAAPHPAHRVHRAAAACGSPRARDCRPRDRR